MLSKYKYPFDYELTPTEIEKGTTWVTLKLKNIGNETLRDLDVQLHSEDTYNLTVYGTWWIGVNAIGSADAYATINGSKDGKYFWWESSRTNLNISDEKAKIGHLLVLSNPYTSIGKTISAETTVKGLRKGTGLKLEFWVETPSGKNEQQSTTETKELSAREDARYSTEFTPKEIGYYTIYAYLYDGWKRISYKTETIYAQKSYAR